MTKKENIVLDTNAIISIISRKLKFQNILYALINGEFNLFVTTEIILEYEEKIRLSFDDQQVNLFLQLLDILPNIYKISIFYDLNIINADPSDNKFVNCAFASNAKYIVTNDKHFNVLKNINFPKINVITIEKFSKKITEKL